MVVHPIHFCFETRKFDPIAGGGVFVKLFMLPSKLESEPCTVDEWNEEPCTSLVSLGGSITHTITND